MSFTRIDDYMARLRAAWNAYRDCQRFARQVAKISDADGGPIMLESAKARVRVYRNEVRHIIMLIRLAKKTQAVTAA